jgi:hypothetical protein
MEYKKKKHSNETKEVKRDKRNKDDNSEYERGFNKDIDHLKRPHRKLGNQNSLSQIKNAVERDSSRLEQVEDTISELEDK